ncbi:FecCD family ABC transporter permease [Calothrix sp. PCC 6303]|uniref:FecCD family ABC transporter permease n=1 Tax=Calothrix sp. PCC 6303 TaxID=1170562 RepID=UPI0002A0188B|nr:iron ABC transporter permease [Calothrix sp. PCC 6303]AFZ01591.1 transport system permease protein [Calothrix sp. PCC 6303]
MLNGTSPLPKDSKQVRLFIIGLVVALLILLTSLIFSVTLGAAKIPLDAILQSFLSFDASREHLIIRTVRLPRSLLAMVVGASISVAGALMQGVTRNPLADPGILGVSSGAAFSVVMAIFLLGASTQGVYIWYAFLGAGITAFSVYFLASLGRGGATPLNLTIAGAAISSLLASLTSGVLIVSQRTLEEIKFWLAGSLAGTDTSIILQVLPYVCIGMILALAISRQVTILSLGEDIAKGLGQQTTWVKIAAVICVLLLDGSAVAVAGAIGFLGLVVPHIVRFVVGVDYRWIIPYSALFGAILLLVADILGRLVIQPQEVPVGIMTALIGAPFFVYLAKTKVKK